MAELQAPDLRIGNKLLRKFWNPQPGNEHYAWEECEVVLIRPDSINIKLRGGAIIGKVPFENLKPMPITQNWLGNSGLFGQSDEHEFVLLDGPEVYYDTHFKRLFFGETVLMPKLEFVHQMQNFIHSITA